MRAAQALLLGDREQARGARVPDLVHRVAEPGHAAGPPPWSARTRSSASASQPASSAGSGSVEGGQRVARKRPASSVTPRNRDPPPSSPAASAPCSESGRGQVGQAGRDGGRGEAVVGQRDEHRLEHPHLAGRRAAPGDQPEGQLAEADLAHEVGGQVLAEQVDRRRRRRCRARSGSRGSVIGLAPCASSLGQPGADLARRARRAPAAAGRSARASAEKRDRVADRGHGGGPRRRPATTGSRPELARAKATPSSTVLIGPHGTPAAISSRNHSSRGPGAQPLDEQRAQLVAVGGAVLVAREARVVDQLGRGRAPRRACGTGRRCRR